MYIFNQLKKQKVELNIIDEIFQYTSCSISFGNKRIIILVKIPKLEVEPYDLISLENININGSTVESHFHLVAKRHDKIFVQQTKCKICEDTTPLRDECIFNMLTHLTPRCHLTRQPHSIRIKEVLKGIILIDTNTNILVSDSCGKKKIINEPTIIEVNECKVQILNYTFTRDPQQTFNTEYLAPIYGNALQTIKPTLEAEIEPLHIDKIRELQKVQLRLDQTEKHFSYGAVTLIILLTIYGSFRLVKYNIRKRRVKETISPNLFQRKQNHEPEKQEDNDPQETASKTSWKKKPILLPRFALHTSTEDV